MENSIIKHVMAVLWGALATMIVASNLLAQEALLPTGRLDRAQAFEAALEAPVTLAEAYPQPKSKYKAGLLSALIPGLGEAYAGHKGRAIAFGTVEAGIWVTYGVYKGQENLRHDRAIEYAVGAAGANSNGNEEYYKAVARFRRSDGPGMWNEYVRRQARETGEFIGPEYTGADAWAWNSEANLVAYRELRRKELSAEESATNMFAFAILNRVLSIVDAVYIVTKDHQASEQAGFGLRIETVGPTTARVMLQNRF